MGRIVASIAGGFDLGMILYPSPGPTVEGPRLGDLTVTASTYGVARPIVFGTVQVAGNLIWGLPIKEVATRSQVGRGKGSVGSKSGNSTSIAYTYTSTFALALCQGPVEQIVRIWMNGAVVYDVSSGSNTVNNGDTAINFRFYPGNDTQLPDSLIEADKGVGNVSAYRGLCYLVFDSLLLTNFGDRIPNIQVELTTGATFSQDFQQLSRTNDTPTFQTLSGVFFVEQDGFINGSGVQTLQTIVTTSAGGILSLTDVPGVVPNLFTSYPDYAIAINPQTQRGFVWGLNPNGIAEFDLNTMTVVAEYTLDYALGLYNTYTTFGLSGGFNALWIGFDQLLYGNLGDRLVKINPGTFRNGQVIPYGNDDNAGSPFSNNFAQICGPVAMLGPNGIENYTLICGGNMQHVIGVDFDGRPRMTSTGSPVAIVPGAVNQMNGSAYLTGNGPASLTIDKVQIACSVDVGLTGADFSRSMNLVNVGNIVASDVEIGATGWFGTSGSGLVYDSVDNSILFQGQVGHGSAGNWYLIKWSENGGLIWATQLPAGLNGGGTQSNMTSDLREGVYAFFWGANAVEFDTATGAITGNYTWGLTGGGAQVFSGKFNAIIMPSSGPFLWGKAAVGRFTGSAVNLGTIATTVCEEAGLQSSDIDVSALASIPVPGFAIAQRATGDTILKPLLQLYQVDVVERDYKLVFQLRGGAVAATITEDLMIRTAKSNTDTGEPYDEARTQELGLPMRYTVSYIDTTAQYQTNTQMAKRTVSPNRTMYSDQQIDLQVGLVMTPDEAAQRAETLLYAAWLERHSFKCSLPPGYMNLDAADPVTLTLDNGFTMRGRLGPFDIGADGSIQTTIIGETDGQYTSTATGAAATIPPNVVPFLVPTNMFLLDTPLLRDTDDTAGVSLRAYWGAAPYATGTWGGAQLQGSSDATTWTGIDVDTSSSPWGYIEQALPDAASCYHIRETEMVTVRMPFGGDTLANCTDIQLAAGTNALAVFKANGDIEILGFQSVTPLANNRYLLTTLLRGQRGTDTMAAGHAAGEMFIMLNSGTIDPITLPLAARGVQGFFRAVTLGTLPSSAALQNKTFRGRDQMPYAPEAVTATLSGSDIVITWLRRCRVNGGLQAGTPNVPVGEQSEKYEIDIYDADGDTVLRTLTATGATVTYLAADIVTDFGSTPVTLTTSVYQISATVGRGFARLDTLGVM